MSVTQLINIVLTKLPKNFAMMAAILTASDGELDLETVTAKLQCVELRHRLVTPLHSSRSSDRFGQSRRRSSCSRGPRAR